MVRAPPSRPSPQGASGMALLGSPRLSASSTPPHSSGPTWPPCPPRPPSGHTPSLLRPLPSPCWPGQSGFQSMATCDSWNMAALLSPGPQTEDPCLWLLGLVRAPPESQTGSLRTTQRPALPGPSCPSVHSEGCRRQAPSSQGLGARPKFPIPAAVPATGPPLRRVPPWSVHAHPLSGSLEHSRLLRACCSPHPRRPVPPLASFKSLPRGVVPMEASLCLPAGQGSSHSSQLRLDLFAGISPKTGPLVYCMVTPLTPTHMTDCTRGIRTCELRECVCL